MKATVVVTGVSLGHAPLVVTRPPTAAAYQGQHPFFAARAALKRANSARAAAQFQLDRLRALVATLEGARR